MSNEDPGFLLRTFKPNWVDLAPYVQENESLERSTAKLWALILTARHIPCKVKTRPRAAGGGQTVQVQKWYAQRAAEEIELYYHENIPDGRSLFLHDLRPVGGLEPTIGVMTCLVMFFWLYNRVYPSLALYPKLWLDRGSASAEMILSGEVWRLFTALTLHGDGAHVIGNALIGGVFVWLASRRLGSGLAWLLTIVGGGLGNLFNAMALGAPHNSIGFSTASFAAAGLLAGIAPSGIGGGIHGFGRGSIARRVLRFISSAFLPFAAGLGLLAMLGAGEDTDLGAHLFGFLTGVLLGLWTGVRATRGGLPEKATDSMLFCAALAIPCLAWGVAWLA